MRLDDAWTATTRFGLGARPGDLEEAARDPRGWLLAQLEGAVPAGPRGLPDSADVALEVLSARGEGDLLRTLRRSHRDLFGREARARLGQVASSERPFVERWVSFWSDHFTVSAAKGPIVGAVGAFEREAVRPHALGTFEELLLATTRHPAMLVYLDNAQSIGPHSRAGLRRERGLNENLAREILELHTLGVDGGYDQADVEGFAAVLTGWGLDRDTGAFAFHRRRHEPGVKTLLGERYGEGEREGVRALRTLGAHPSTARNIARELCRHFVDDRPSPPAVASLERTFLRTGGDLRAMATAVVSLEAAWTSAGSKVKSPWDLVVSAARATGGGVDRGRGLLAALRHLGQLPWTAASPAGWPDDAEAWVGPEAILRRIEFASGFARRFGGGRRGADVAADVLGPRCKAATRRALSRTDEPDGLAMVLASAEFQRR
jgi:uncharacterized protein (DUF1800 family)